ncbi:hypothetical protein [Pseudoclavibacter sp. RFBA6]|uniref:hypothetical protein n=1 Tax=Pseudoclavibacter sp. RFBA6 TaxID=2080573 RepID=UPI000CE8BD8A|nr:hypothetical protein [Pseudoclavibacter sp. RFBA6]
MSTPAASRPRRPHSEVDSGRRAILRGSAWAVPAIAVAVAAPHAAASTAENLGAYSLTGTCGVLGLVGPGFLLRASSTSSLPADTTVTVIGSGIANIGFFSVTGGTARVAVLSGTSRQITLTAPLAADATLAIRTTLSISDAFTLNAVTALPTGYVATGAKSAGSVSSTRILCSGT